MPPISLDRPIAKGRTAEVYAWETGQVIKLFYPGTSPAALEQEIAVSRVIAAKALPTPKFLGAQTVQDRTGLIYERVDGVSMLSVIFNRPWLIARLGRQLAEVQTAIHRQPGTGLNPLRAWLRRSIDRAANLPADLKSMAHDRLDRLPDGEALLHFDLHPDQVMLTTGGPIVIDWNNAVQGSPPADVARSVLMLTMGEPVDANPVMLAAVRLLRGGLYQSYIQRYLKLNPAVTMDQVQAWMVPVAAARLYEHIPGEADKLIQLLRQAQT